MEKLKNGNDKVTGEMIKGGDDRSGGSAIWPLKVLSFLKFGGLL